MNRGSGRTLLVGIRVDKDLSVCIQIARHVRVRRPCMIMSVGIEFGSRDHGRNKHADVVSK